jgi:hypothetical protein
MQRFKLCVSVFALQRDARQLLAMAHGSFIQPVSYIKAARIRVSLFS